MECTNFLPMNMVYLIEELCIPHLKLVMQKFYSGGDTLFRVNSFANEPKRLSYFMVIGVLILVKYKNYFLNKWGVIRTLLMIVCPPSSIMVDIFNINLSINCCFSKFIVYLFCSCKL